MRLPRLRRIDRGSSALLVVLGSLACLLTAGLRPARAQTTADLFDVNTIQENPAVDRLEKCASIAAEDG